MLQRGVVVSHDAVRRWCAKSRDIWHLDEVFIKINAPACPDTSDAWPHRGGDGRRVVGSLDDGRTAHA